MADNITIGSFKTKILVNQDQVIFQFLLILYI